MSLPLFVLLFLACDKESDNNTVQFTVQTIENVRTHPEQTVSLCRKIIDLDYQEQCFLIGLDVLREKSIEQTALLCQESPKTLQEECFFRLAEKSLSKEHCLQLELLQDRCLMHLLNRRIVERRITSFEEGALVAEEYSLPLHRGTQNVIYHYLLSADKIVYIQKCKKEEYPQACEEAAITLYLRRLRDLEVNTSEPCQAIEKFPHFDHARLKKEHQYFTDRVCSK